MKPFIEDGRVWFDREAYETIGTTSEDICWICEKLLANTRYDPVHRKLYSISLRWLLDNCFEEHLEQLIGVWENKTKEKVKFT
jgi:hypothetical protein